MFKRSYLITLGLIIISFFIGKFSSASTYIATNQETRQSGYRFISPLLSCDSSYYPPDPKLGFLKKRVDSYLQNHGSANTVSVFFRHLNNGPVFGVEENALYSPASLLKVPIMMALFKQADTSSPDYLNQTILVKSLPPTPISFSDTSSILKINQEYSIIQLIEHMIVDSDNQAAAVLKQFLGEDTLLKTYSDLGIDLPTRSDDDPISTKTYSSLFRILYNSSYLSRRYSETALSLLSQTVYKEGLVAKLPSDITVSHKFGERYDGKVYQLHDCGIVYFPTNPYLLCVMTKGSNPQELSTIISDISDLIFSTIVNPPNF